MTHAPVWDAQQYARFKKERAQPFHDLLSRVPEREDISRIADLGCGDGELTRTLLGRWPRARIWGVDSSAEMLAKARGPGNATDTDSADSLAGHSASETPLPGSPRRSSSDRSGRGSPLERISQAPSPGSVQFLLDDLRSWEPPEPLDLIVSNAALHWVPDHDAVLHDLARRLARGGVLAVQVPSNGKEAAYRILEDLLEEPVWRDRLGRGVQRPHVESLPFYETRLRGLGFDVETWETIYAHRLAAAREIVEWVKGTSLRPVLTALSEAEGAALLTELTSRIEPAYPADRWGVLFPFRRLFFVAVKPKSA